MGRRRFSEREVIETLAWQGLVIRCYRCGHLIAAADGKAVVWPFGLAEREHLHEVKLGGPDVPGNCRYSHKGCHARITNGTPATTAGSSKHRIAKTKGTRAEKFAVAKKPLDEPREKSRWGWDKMVKRASGRTRIART
jgi:hypothetical protein